MVGGSQVKLKEVGWSWGGEVAVRRITLLRNYYDVWCQMYVDFYRYAFITHSCGGDIPYRGGCKNAMYEECTE